MHGEARNSEQFNTNFVIVVQILKKLLDFRRFSSILMVAMATLYLIFNNFILHDEALNSEQFITNMVIPGQILKKLLDF
jgi:hypothetical protein